MSKKIMGVGGFTEHGTPKALEVNDRGSLSTHYSGHKGSVINTIASNIEVPAGGDSGYIVLGLDGTESEVWVFCETNVSPWTLKTTGYPWSSRGTYTHSLFPRRYRVDETFPNPPTPATSFLTGIPPAYDPDNLDVPTSLEEAKMVGGCYFPRTEIRFENHGDEDAIVTIKVLRIWGV